MFNIAKIQDVDNNREERRIRVKKDILNWLTSASMVKLIELFGGDVSYTDLSDIEVVKYLYSFSRDRWDFRKGRKERFEIKEALNNKKNAMILQMVEELGICDGMANMDDIVPPDYVLILGGARMSNFNRTLMSKRVVDVYKEARVVALTAYRQLKDEEIPYVRNYSPSATTELEAINAAIEKIYNIRMSLLDSYIDANPFLNEALYGSANPMYDIHTICASTSDATRRGNSLDTFMAFFKKFSTNSGENVLLVTSSIYLPYQLLKFAPLAIENDINVEIIGVDRDIQGNGKRNGILYLQEIQASIGEIYNLLTGGVL